MLQRIDLETGSYSFGGRLVKIPQGALPAMRQVRVYGG